MGKNNGKMEGKLAKLPKTIEEKYDQNGQTIAKKKWQKQAKIAVKNRENPAKNG